MPLVILPVGMSMGQDYGQGDPDQRPSEYLEVHLGRGPVALTVDEVTAWTTALLDPERHANHDVTRQSLEQSLRRAEVGLEESDTVVSGLLDRGLLVEFDPAEGPLEELFRAHQLLPLAQGYGNSPDDPFRYQIGFGGHVVVSVSADVYDIWGYALTGSTLWDACAALAEGINTDERAGAQRLASTADDVARDVAAALPVLVTSGCALLDPVNYPV